MTFKSFYLTLRPSGSGAITALLESKVIASPADILRRASRVPSPRAGNGEGTRDARLTMPAGEASKVMDSTVVFKKILTERFNDRGVSFFYSCG